MFQTQLHQGLCGEEDVLLKDNTLHYIQSHSELGIDVSLEWLRSFGAYFHGLPSGVEEHVNVEQSLDEWSNQYHIEFDKVR